MENKLLEYALKYSKIGWYVFPCRRNNKHPMTKNGFKDATIDEQVIRRWWTRNPDAMIGVACGKSGFVVIDIDDKDGRFGSRTWEAIKHEDIITVESITPTAGRHLLFELDEKRKIHQDSDIYGHVGIDIRNQGGYIIVEPSLMTPEYAHSQILGKDKQQIYEWVEDQSPFDMKPIRMPDWVYELFKEKKESEKEKFSLPDNVPKGQQDDTFFRFACSLKAQGYDPDMVRGALKISIEERCEQDKDDPFTCKDIERWIKQAFKYDDEKKDKKKIKKNKFLETSFIVLEDGQIAEMVCDRADQKVQFAVYDKETGESRLTDSVLYNGKTVIPYQNDFLINPVNPTETPVVLLPSKTEEYNLDKELFDEIKCFIHKHVGLNECFEKLATIYVMFSWLYDCFTVLPYIRVLGDFGTGKSRFLSTIGSICYKPMTIVAAVGEAPIFRMIQRYKGTLVLDEANFKHNDVNAAIMQILNAGYEKRTPVVRCDSKDYEKIIQCQVFGPKIISSREKWKDLALESRCLTHMSNTSERIQAVGADPEEDDIPIYLGHEFDRQALQLRNKLLLYRFRNYGEKEIDVKKLKYPVEPRISQILLPLANLTSDEQVLEEINNIAKQMNKERIEDRSSRYEAKILQVIKNIEEERIAKGEKIYIKEIADSYNKEAYNEKEKMSPQRISYYIRKPELAIELQPKDRDGRSIICNSEQMNKLYIKYGIITADCIDNESVGYIDCDDVTAVTNSWEE
ncbi:MAG: bifunctional DNA primase/polymerase [Candidatus Omnitrophica bacterium]|nr:bifunctional DNA primase/polymerase [Candidatus Omnitrophota bacterium]